MGSGVTNTLGASRAGIKKLAASPRMPFKRDDHDAKTSREEKVPDNLYQRHKIAVSRYVSQSSPFSMMGKCMSDDVSEKVLCTIMTF